MDDRDKIGPPFLFATMFSTQDNDLQPRKERGWGLGTPRFIQQQPLDGYLLCAWHRARGWVSKDLPLPGQHGHMLEKEMPEELEGPGDSCHSGAVREDKD